MFKATFHGKDVAMKYIPLDKDKEVKDNYEYDESSYGCHEFCEQEKFGKSAKAKPVVVNYNF